MGNQSIQKLHREALIEETINEQARPGISPCSVKYVSGEEEAMYFKSIRDFFKTYFFKSLFPIQEMDVSNK